MWSADKSAIQEQLGERLTSVILTLESTPCVLHYLEAFWNIMAIEWNGIDRFRHVVFLFGCLPACLPRPVFLTFKLPCVDSINFTCSWKSVSFTLFDGWNTLSGMRHLWRTWWTFSSNFHFGNSDSLLVTWRRFFFYFCMLHVSIALWVQPYSLAWLFMTLVWTTEFARMAFDSFSPSIFLPKVTRGSSQPKR